MTKSQKKQLIRIIFASVLTVAGLFAENYEALRVLLAFASFITVGYSVIIEAFRGAMRGQLFDENFLMGIASIGAFLCGDYVEAAAVLLFYQVGELFESYAVDKSRRNIAALLDISSDRASMEIEGEIREVPAEEVPVGSIIIVKPGEKIPIDGRIIEGETQLDSSALTGESVPRTAREGEVVFSGCVNLTVMIKLETVKEFYDSTANKIIELIELSSAKKSKSENFITKFARVYTPVVCALAVILALAPPLFALITGGAPLWLEWIKRALTFLVISCPCALVVSVPMSFFGGISAVSKRGILIKGSSYLETLSKVSAVAFDKTGTLTEGSFEVTKIETAGCDEEVLLELAAAAEVFSTHPIAKSILKVAKVSPNTEHIKNSEVLAGKGVKCEYKGKLIYAGNDLLMEEVGIPHRKKGQGTAVHVALGGEYMGCISISDKLKGGSKKTVESLKKRGIKTFMLTGDRKNTAENFALCLGIDETYSELLPEDKLTHLEEIMRKNKQGSTAYVGDGINDAPVLMRSDVGIAMGGLGSDAAVEAADVVITDDDPQKLITAIRQSKRTMRIVRQNTVFALGVKFSFLILGALGFSNMWFSIFADVGVLILAVLNAMRCMKI